MTAVYDSLSTSLENAYINAADPAVIDSLTKRIENLTPQNEAAKMQTTTLPLYSTVVPSV